MADPLRHLDVCAGVGGFSLGLRLALGDGVRTVGYVEREAFAAAVLLARMEDETLERAPVWCAPLEELDGGELRGEVDILTAGFPCQPWSCAGKRLGTDDERWLWDDIARLIAAVEPAFVMLENVALDAFRQPFGDLRDLGYELPPPVAVQAAHVGAPHKRERFFALAHASGARSQGARQAESAGTAEPAACGGDDVADTERARLKGERPETRRRAKPFGSGGEGLGVLADPDGSASWHRPWPPGRDPDLWRDIPAETQPGICRVADGFPDWADRLRALGNAVVPQVVAAAWRALTCANA